MLPPISQLGRLLRAFGPLRTFWGGGLEGIECIAKPLEESLQPQSGHSCFQALGPPTLLLSFPAEFSSPVSSIVHFSSLGFWHAIDCTNLLNEITS